jgi:transposase
MPAEHLGTAETVQAYKDLSRVERAFRCMKTDDLEIRPIRLSLPKISSELSPTL